MSKLSEQINTLRVSMRNADAAQSDSFSQVFNEFHDLAEQSALFDGSKPFKDKVLRELLQAIARRHTGDDALVIEGLRIFRFAGTDFLHGMFFAGPRAANFFLFLDEKQGVIAFVGNVGAPTHYYRISAAMLPAGTEIGRKRFTN